MKRKNTQDPEELIDRIEKDLDKLRHILWNQESERENLREDLYRCEVDLKDKS